MTTRRRSTTAVLGAAVLAGTVALTGCGAVSFGAGDSGRPASTAGGQPSQTTTSAQPSSEPVPSGTGAPSSTATATPPKPTPKPSASTTTASPKPKPTVKPTPTAKPTPREGDTLHPGDSGAYVRSVQQRLSALGYWNGAADGSYGLLTSQAVMALQKVAGLGRDGVYGPATRRALQAGVRPQSRTGGTGVEIDKARQLLLVVRGGQVVTILNTSTGSGQPYQTKSGGTAIATTPVGSYSVFRTVDHLDKGPLGDLWRPRYFNGGIAVHGAGSVPGYPASHGCARVSNPAMDMIWARGLMPVGSGVVVY